MDQWGREFLVTFVRNYDQTGENAIYVTARDAATVTVHNELYSNSSSHNVAAQSSVRVSLPTDLHYTEQGVVEMKAVYVNATGDVSVYVVNHRDSSAGLYTAFPIQTMGTRYILYTYTPTYGTYFVIAALYDNTSVSVLLTLKGTGSCLGGLTNGQTATATLNRHSVWGGWCSGQTSFEGSVVTSNKPVTVITGLKCDTVPVNVNFCDHMVEMMPPVEDFGRTFILHNVQYRTSGAIYRVFSAHDNTELMESPGTTRTLNKGEYFDYDLGAASAVELCVVTSQPVLVLMMTKGADTDPSVNGATCTDDVNRFNCTCVAGYTGSACETDIDDCLPSPCQNGATCVDVVNGFNCTCSAGYTGSRCETGDGTVKSSTTIVSGKGGECVCNCKSKLLANLTLEERQQQAEDQAEQLKKDLAVDKAQLSSTIRKVTSAPDHRPSATGIGYVGIVFLVLSFGAIVVMDITGYFHIMHAPAKDIKDTKKPVPRHSDACSVNGHQEHTKKRQDIE
nr:hypothetical protein BaRGS_026060 [Batillaria attramentaria]